MDNETLIQQFAAYLRRRFPDRSTAKHYTSDLRQFSAMCTEPWAAVTCVDIDAFVDQQRQAGRAALGNGFHLLGGTQRIAHADKRLPFAKGSDVNG